MADPVGERQPHGDLAAGQTFGRYAILNRLGSGGMGVVFSAYDPELDRRVALKLLRPETTADGSKAAEHTERLDRSGNTRDLVRERLLAEGRALARLSHRNLITVFEVGAVGEQVYLAMEHVAGVSLEAWLAAAPSPPWREVLGAFVQAGRGLAAAHDAGLVHGDFKPANVVVDESSGRVCVVDFGLACAAGTRTGSSPAGTPRYMSPEQLAGRTVDARADQFAFSVALYEALYGERPFAGPDEAATARSAAARRPSARRGPRRVERAILRALTIDPADRFASMADLLDQLEGRSNALRRTVAGAVLAIAAVLAVAFARAGSSEAEQCGGGPERLAGVWDAGRRALMTRAFAASGRPHAATSAARAGQHLDAYAGGWLKMYRGACLDSARGEQSADLLDRRMACLDRRLDQMRARTALLTARPEGEVVDRALAIVTDIDPLAPCGDAEALLGATAPPADPTLRAAADSIEQMVDRASLDRQAGRLGAALEGVRNAVARARALDHPPIRARAAYVLGRALEDADRPPEAEEALHEALQAAERAGDDALAAEVLLRLVFVAGKSQSRFAEGRTLARLAEAAIGRAGERADPDLHALLLNALGNVAQAQGELREAVSLYEQSLALRRARLPPDDIRLASSENALGNALVRQARYQEAEAHLATALAIRRKTLGEDHPRTSDSYLNLGVSYLEQGRNDDARAQFLRSLAIRKRVPEYSSISVHNNLGNVETIAGNYAEAIRYHQAALAERRERLGPEHPDVGTSLNNIGSVYLAMDDLDRALVLLEQGLALRRRTIGESHPLYASSLLGVGEALQRLGRAREALDHHERAVAILRERLGRDHPKTAGARAHRAIALIDLRRLREAIEELEHVIPLVPEGKPDRAIFEFGLARALWATRGSKSRAIETARRARQAFAASHRPRDVARVDGWLAGRARVSRRK